MARDYVELAEKLMAQLRDEMVEAQRTRAQVIGFKITFVSTAIAVIVASLDRAPRAVVVVPAFAAFFFDLLINSYSVSIKRIGLYCHHHLEPLLRDGHGWPPSVPTWEEFASSQHWKSTLFLAGNLGITTLAAVVAAAVLLVDPVSWLSGVLVGAMAVMIAIDAGAFTRRQELVAYPNASPGLGEPVLEDVSPK